MDTANSGKAIPTENPVKPSGLPYFLQLGILRGSVRHWYALVILSNNFEYFYTSSGCLSGCNSLANCL